METPEQTAPDPRLNHMNFSRKRRKWRWLVAIGLILLAGVIFRYGGRVVRKVQYQLTGSVTALGNTYYIQPEDKMITPIVLDWGVWERSETQEVCEILHPGDTFIDVGADFGWYTVIGAKVVGPTGRVIAFEPVPRNLEFLKAQRRGQWVQECQDRAHGPLEQERDSHLPPQPRQPG